MWVRKFLSSLPMRQAGRGVHHHTALSHDFKRLCCCVGSVATVEAAWTPLLVGDLSVPQLRLCDVGQKDVFDDASLSFVACLPAG